MHFGRCPGRRLIETHQLICHPLTGMVRILWHQVSSSERNGMKVSHTSLLCYCPQLFGVNDPSYLTCEALWLNSPETWNKRQQHTGPACIYIQSHSIKEQSQTKPNERHDSILSNWDDKKGSCWRVRFDPNLKFGLLHTVGKSEFYLKLGVAAHVDIHLVSFKHKMCPYWFL